MKRTWKETTTTNSGDLGYGTDSCSDPLAFNKFLEREMYDNNNLPTETPKKENSEQEIVYNYNSIEEIVNHFETQVQDLSNNEVNCEPQPAGLQDFNNMMLLASVSEQSSPYVGRLISKENILLISQNLIEIGRNSSKSLVDFHVGDNSFISRKHLILHYNKDGQFILLCGSKNGIFIDDVFYPNVNEAIVLPDSCEFLFPKTTIKIRFENLMATRNKMTSNCMNELRRAMTSPDSGYPSPNACNGSQSQDYRMPSTEESTKQYSAAEKPPYSYAQLIVQAISSSQTKKLTLAGIYNYISQKYPFYKPESKGWQNSIRHNLSLNQYFIKVPRCQDEPGKGSFWQLDETSENKLVGQSYRKRGRYNQSQSVQEQNNSTLNDIGYDETDSSAENSRNYFQDQELAILNLIKKEGGNSELKANEEGKEGVTSPGYINGIKEEPISSATFNFSNIIEEAPIKEDAFVYSDHEYVPQPKIRKF